jgi:hypothetical protein
METVFSTVPCNLQLEKTTYSSNQYNLFPDNAAELLNKQTRKRLVQNFLTLSDSVHLLGIHSALEVHHAIFLVLC